MEMGQDLAVVVIHCPVGGLDLSLRHREPWERLEQARGVEHARCCLKTLTHINPLDAPHSSMGSGGGGCSCPGCTDGGTEAQSGQWAESRQVLGAVSSGGLRQLPIFHHEGLALCLVGGCCQRLRPEV